MPRPIRNPYEILPSHNDPLSAYPDHLNGIQIIKNANTEHSKVKIPDIIEGKVLLVTEGTIKYSPPEFGVSDNNNGNGFLKAHGVYARTTINEASIPDPYGIVALLTKQNTTITLDEKRALQNQLLTFINLHPLLVPLKKEERKPVIGETIRIHLPESLKHGGQPITGYYEIITNNNSNFIASSDEKLNQVLNEIKNPPEEQEEEIIEQEDSEVPTPVAASEANQQQNSQYNDCTDTNDPNCLNKYISNPELKAYGQGDGDWALDVVSTQTGKRMKEIGCTITCLTMISNFLNGFDLSPKDALESLKNDNALKNSGDIKSYKIAGDSLLIQAVGEKKLGTSTDEIRNFIIDSLRARDRRIVMLQVEYGSNGKHFLVCYKIDSNGDFICNDPILKNYSIIIKSQRMSCFMPINPPNSSLIYRIVRAISFKTAK